MSEASVWQRVRAALPHGQTLPASTWRRRHRWILILLWAQAAGLVLFAVLMGEGLGHGLLEGGLIAAAGGLAVIARLPVRLRAAAASVGLVSASAVLTHLSGGYIESHFHFFVMMGVIVLYEDWIPFLLSILYVAVHHGIVGWLDPTSVYNHPAALAQPFLWAGIHATFILAMCSALVVYWRSNERARHATRAVLDSAGEGIIGLDADQRITFANPAAARIARRPIGALEGLGLAALLPGVRPSDSLQRGEADVRRPDSTTVPVEWTWTQASDDTLGAVLTLRDATASHAAQLEIRETLSLLAATLESTADGILVVDRDGRITQSNERFRQMWRLPKEAVASRDDAHLLALVVEQLDEPERFLAKVKALYAAPESESFDLLRFRDGRVFERYSRPQRIGGQVVGRVWSFRDITERVRAEDERRREEERARKAKAREEEIERLQELDRFKTDFINATAHELRTPLTPIKVHLSLLARTHEGRNLDVIKRNVARLERLIEDELSIVRLQRGRLELKTESFDLSAMLREVHATYEEPAEAAGVRLVQDVHPALPLKADAKRIHQVLDNLASNAIKFTPPGGRVLIRARPTSTGVRVSVADTGRGLAPEQAIRLFQPFSRPHEDDPTAPPGTGLGLYICRSIVELHGGRIWCESQGPGQGATFHVDLPAVPPVHAPGAEARAPA